MMRRVRPIVLLLLLLAPVAAAWAFPWDKDMVDQPIAKPQRQPAPPEPNGVPVQGTETLPAPEDEAGQFEAKEAAASIPNPVAATPESIANGKYLYEINCLVCHGVNGMGNGPVGEKLVEKAPVDLNDAYTQDQTDGQLFFTLTRGRVTMPYYRDALNKQERWDVINYVRAEFGSQ